MTDQLPLSSPLLSGSVQSGPGMAQCSITKKWFPEDEVVTFQGQLVSAEGKQILLDRLRTGAGEPGALASPGVFRRFVCISVDWLIILLVWVVLSVTAIKWVIVALHLGLRSHLALFFGYSLLAIVSLLYFSILHGGMGKSIGKVLGHLRVVNLDGSRASWKTSFLRSKLYPGTIVIIAACGLLPSSVGEGSFEAALGLAAVAFMIWVLADALVALFDTRMQRSLHDRICGTRVICDRG